MGKTHANARVNGVLLDLSGVLYVGDAPLPGAMDALRRLLAAGLPVRYVTNTTRKTRARIVQDLNGMGFDISETDVFTPTQAVRDYLQAHHLCPYLLVHPALESEFADMPGAAPDAVVLGDAGHDFTYERLNQAFRLLMAGAPLLAMGDNRYFREAEGLSLDIGPFKAALEYAADKQAVVLGKPAKAFFLEAVVALGCGPAETVMVGDDAPADVGGALRAGLSGILVHTGKYQPGDEARVGEPGAVVVDDIAAAVDWILEHR